MNKFLILIGVGCSIFWGFVTLITFGVPLTWCKGIDEVTFHLMHREVYQMANGFHYDVNNNDMPTVILIGIFWVICLLVFLGLRKVDSRSPQRFTLGIIIFFALLFRLILLPGVLIHENDIYRYLWDAKSAASGINPFKYAPADVFMFEHGYQEDYYDENVGEVIKGRVFSLEDHVRLDRLVRLRDQKRVFYNRIGHWQISTIYPPVTQMVFWVTAKIRKDSILFMKFIFVLFDMGTMFVIIGLLRHFGKSPCMSLVYGWSPLILYEISNRGHYDAIPIFFMVLSLYLIFKGKKKFAGVGILALAALAKFFSGVLLPLVVRPVRVRYWIFFAAVFVACYVPYVFWDETGVRQIFAGFGTYNADWFYNASVAALVYVSLDYFLPALMNPFFVAKAVVGGLYLIFLARLIWQKPKDDWHTLEKCFLAVAVLFIINPVGDPWYFCWSIPFLCFFPRRSWLLLSGLLVLSYLNFHSDIPIVNARFIGISLISWLIYVPFFLYLLGEEVIDRIRKVGITIQ